MGTAARSCDVEPGTHPIGNAFEVIRALGEERTLLDRFGSSTFRTFIVRY